MDQLRRKKKMSKKEEKLKEQKVTYSIELDGKFYIVENVPARVNEDTGEQYFAPETVENLQKKIRENKQPKRTMETPVFDYSG